MLKASPEKVSFRLSQKVNAFFQAQVDGRCPWQLERIVGKEGRAVCAASGQNA